MARQSVLRMHGSKSRRVQPLSFQRGFLGDSSGCSTSQLVTPAFPRNKDALAKAVRAGCEEEETGRGCKGEEGSTYCLASHSSQASSMSNLRPRKTANSLASVIARSWPMQIRWPAEKGRHASIGTCSGSPTLASQRSGTYSSGRAQRLGSRWIGPTASHTPKPSVGYLMFEPGVVRKNSIPD